MEGVTVIVVMLTASWCGPCDPAKRALKRFVGSSIGSSTNIDPVIVDIDSDKGCAYARRYGVRSVPTFLTWAKITHVFNREPLVRETGWPTDLGKLASDTAKLILGFETTPARYAKGKVAVRPLDGKGGFKGRCERLISDHLKVRWSNRERAFIATPTKVRKLRKLYDEGYDASIVTGGLEGPT